MRGLSTLLSSTALAGAIPAALAVAMPYAGEASSDIFPPTQTANDPGDGPFPTNVGYPGPTPTGAEPFLIQGAPSTPKRHDWYPLVRPGTLDTSADDDWNVMTHGWGNLGPAVSLPADTFGLPRSSDAVPSQCSLSQIHLVSRHGARYPTSDGGTASFAQKIANASKAGEFKATGPLEFMNDWEYELGAEILSTFGRKQLFELGAGMRQKYGRLLNGFEKTERLPVFRTTSEDRMLKSALNFAAGFFGIPNDDMYHLEIIVENDGFNNTLAPWNDCPNGNTWYDLPDKPVDKWVETYLQDAVKRIQPHIKGVNLTVTDIYNMQSLCPYETVNLGWSKFCQLFTKEEWEGYDYSIDLDFWYGDFFGNPAAAAQGIGWVEELTDRLIGHLLANASIAEQNTTLNYNTDTFPLDQPLYADFSHDTVITVYLVALNFTFMADTGPYPWTHIPPNRSYYTRQVVPFNGNLQIQVMDCPSSMYSKDASGDEKMIRFILNDAVLPLTGLEGCEENEQGLCPATTVIKSLKKRIHTISYDYDCYGNYTAGYNITSGRPYGQHA